MKMWRRKRRLETSELIVIAVNINNTLNMSNAQAPRRELNLAAQYSGEEFKKEFKAKYIELWKVMPFFTW